MYNAFDRFIALKYGLVESVIINYIAALVGLNSRRKEHLYDGRYWMSFTKQSFEYDLPFIPEKSIRNILYKLVNGHSKSSNKKLYDPVLIEGSYNEDENDKTCWYAFIDQNLFCSI